MALFQMVVLAVIQGLTEFLPVSSSGHLALLPQLTNFPDQGQFIDVAVHIGTLGAVSLYFRSDVLRAGRGVAHIASGRRGTEEARLALALAAATVPVVVAGFLLWATGISEHLRSIRVIAWTTVVFALLLYWFDRSGSSARSAADWNLRHAWILGMWQVLALVPGTSRSGITITGARSLGYARTDSARIAMLMSIPAIAASGTLLGADAVLTADVGMLRDGAVAAALAFLAALAALSFMMRLLRRCSYSPFVAYRLALGCVLLWIAYA